MNRRDNRSPRFSAAGLTTSSILALIVAMAISVSFDVPPSGAPGRTTAASAIASARA